MVKCSQIFCLSSFMAISKAQTTDIFEIFVFNIVVAIKIAVYFEAMDSLTMPCWF